MPAASDPDPRHLTGISGWRNQFEYDEPFGVRGVGVGAHAPQHRDVRDTGEMTNVLRVVP